MHGLVNKTMKRKYILFIICSFFLGGVSAQTLEQARTLFTKGDYEQAKPVFQKYAKSQPSNGNYSYWFILSLIHEIECIIAFYWQW